MQNINKSQEEYPFLDGFRALGILGVILAHINNFFKTSNLEGPIFAFISFLGPLGHLGVDIFFVISGFLITGILIPHFEKNIDIKRFYLRRAFKILPLYIALCLFIRWLAYVFNINFSFQALFNHLFFIQNFFIPYWTLGHTWSLAIEEHFYLIYPLIVWLIFAKIPDPTKRHWTLIGTLSLFILLILCARHGIDPRTFFSTMVYQDNLVFTTLFRADGLLFGCILRLCEPYYKYMRNDRDIMAPICLLGATTIFFYLRTKLDAGNMIICWDKYLLTYAATILMFFTAYRGFKPFNWLVENRASRWVGKISYALYLWHYVILFLVLKLRPELGPSTCLIIYIFTALATSALLTFTIERYFLNLRSKFFP